jgi:hypothetical protein
LQKSNSISQSADSFFIAEMYDRRRKSTNRSSGIKKPPDIIGYPQSVAVFNGKNNVTIKIFYRLQRYHKLLCQYPNRLI